MKEIIGFILLIIVLGVISGLLQGTKKKKRRSSSKWQPTEKKKTSASFNRSSTTCRPDEVILTAPLDQINGAEFERLLSLYFRDQGYTVKEVGVGGRDGGVDLVIIDKRGEKTAVQAKCYADHNKVQVMTVRELVAAKRNHDCILSLLITTSDLTADARREAEQFKVDYWHGGLIENKLRAWGKWQPGKGNKKPQKATSTGSTVRAVTCACGAPMVARKNKEGKTFWGCSTYPACRKTKAM
ncbi:restriction endonuclease [Paenibacillus antibioticophila]|uniref:restriction endonuclease n=1 Tax=Paenibacillus antibioticophila TaxID=1274374 RepID=UPI0005C956D0|nr:restriction endonuclease [Paenibacillus antibioticophila]